MKDTKHEEMPEADIEDEKSPFAITIGEVAETYADLNLQSDELRAQYILGLSWGSSRLKTEGLLAESALLSIVCDLIRETDVRTIDLFSTRDEFNQALQRLAKIAIADLTTASKIDDPFSFFFACAAWWLEGVPRPQNTIRSDSPQSIEEIEGGDEVSEDTSTVRVVSVHTTKSGNYPPIRICVFPGCDTPEKAVRAHSISESNFLKPFTDNENEFWNIAYPDNIEVGRFVWNRITAAEASRFTGLCRYHDDIFQPLDTSTPTECLHSDKLLSLMAFRSVLHGYWKKLDVGYRTPLLGWHLLILAGATIKGLRNHADGIWRSDSPYGMPRESLRLLRNECQKIVEEEAWENIEHHIFEFPGVSPKAISSGVSAVYEQQGIPTPAFVNIFPTDRGMVAVISHFKAGGIRLLKKLKWLKEQSQSEQKRQLTWMGMYHWYNTYFTDEYYKSLSKTQLKNIIDMAMVYSWLPGTFNEGTIRFQSARIYDGIRFSFFG